MVRLVGKGDIPSNWSKRSTYFFEWTRLASMLTIEPAIPGNRFGLENAHFLRDSNNIYILCRNTRIRYDLLDGLSRHSACHFHAAEPLFGNSGKNFPIFQDCSRGWFTIDNA